MTKEQDPRWEKIKEITEQALKEKNIPGCALGIFYDGEFQMAAFGVTNVENQLPVNPGTVFQIGSISKLFTATLAMQLVEQGKLDLHTSIKTYLPDLKLNNPAVTEAVTAYHLLTHTGGWDGDFFIDTGEGDDALQKYVERMASREMFSPLGKYFGYNNAGFTLLGHLIETLAEKRLEDLLRENILKPLAMENTFLTAGETITHSFAVGHSPSPDGPVVTRPWHLQRNVLPAGAIITDLKDLLLFAQAYLAQGKTKDDGQLLKPETIAEMHKVQVPIWESDKAAVGLSWFRREVNDTYYVSHGGGTNGQVSQLLLLPEHKFAMAIFTNSDDGGAVTLKILRAILKEYFEIEAPQPKAIESTPEELAAFVGSYTNQFYTIHTNMLAGKLVAILKYNSGFPTEDDPPFPSPPPFTIERCEADRLIVMDGDYKDAPIDILRDAAGQIENIRMSGRILKFSPLQE